MSRQQQQQAGIGQDYHLILEGVYQQIRKLDLLAISLKNHLLSGAF